MAGHRSIPIVLMALLLPALLIAQWQVNRQIASPGAAGSVRFANSIQNQSASYMTPSQAQMAVHASGATPSELRMQAARVGPMSPSGAIAYIPPPPTYRSTYTGPTGNYMNTQVSPMGRAPVSYGFPSSALPTTGSVHYSAPPAASYQPSMAGSSLAPASAFMSAPSTGAAYGQTYGSVRYAR